MRSAALPLQVGNKGGELGEHLVAMDKSLWNSVAPDRERERERENEVCQNVRVTRMSEGRDDLERLLVERETEREKERARERESARANAVARFLEADRELNGARVGERDLISSIHPTSSGNRSNLCLFDRVLLAISRCQVRRDQIASPYVYINPNTPTGLHVRTFKLTYVNVLMYKNAYIHACIYANVYI